MLDKVTRFVKEFAEVSPISKLVTVLLALTVIVFVGYIKEREKLDAIKDSQIKYLADEILECRRESIILENDYRNYLKYEKNTKLNYGKD